MRNLVPFEGMGANSQYKQLEAAIERLKSTNISIRSKEKGRGRRRFGSFSLIGDSSVISNQETGEILEVSIAARHGERSEGA